MEIIFVAALFIIGIIFIGFGIFVPRRKRRDEKIYVIVEGTLDVYIHSDTKGYSLTGGKITFTGLAPEK